MTDTFEDDPRYVVLPRRIRTQLQRLRPTGLSEGVTWQDVWFKLKNSESLCNLSVFDHKWVMATPAVLATLEGVEFVYDDNLQKQTPAGVSS